MTREAVFIFDADGAVRHLVDTFSEQIGAAIGPKTSTMRASHVEVFGNLSADAKAEVRHLHPFINRNSFWVDMSPVGGPVMGPFADYDVAIQTEIDYLQAHNLPKINAAKSST